MNKYCEYCDQPAELVTGDVIYPHRPDLSKLNFWLCRSCDAYCGCHKRGAHVPGLGTSDGTLPLGRLADAELRKWKSAAHAAFDPIWKSGRMNRSRAYNWLAHKLQIPLAKCHIGMFDVETCKKVLAFCRELKSTT